MRRCTLPFLFFLANIAFGQQSALDPAGPQAGRIRSLESLLFGISVVIFVGVIGTLAVALFRRRRGIQQEPLESTHRPSAQTERKLLVVVSSLSAVSLLILFALIVVSVVTGREISIKSLPRDSLVVEVTGNQWWWSVRYLDDNTQRIIVTANEIHIPTGRPVVIKGTSHDVIHSFWVPNLHGKRDLIPSRVNTEWIQADRPGRFRGQCAEFCGLQHAHMAFWVIAEPPAQFEAWRRQQLQPAAEPSDPVRLRGQQVFLNNACVLCHTIQGTTAAGQNGPDLTHFGSRQTIAAGTLPNTIGNLGGWITDPQTVKPGNHMPQVPLAPGDEQPLLAYLEGLK
ncbi:MAG TPA: cytochrome c oxidase subunit II [Bryobacteraceae bacterium]|jgi:cytochrome c oxidase subunit 2|nr:cytochrome c oxidase subunit II [Bryobacteraceae bacterium]